MPRQNRLQSAAVLPWPYEHQAAGLAKQWDLSETSSCYTSVRLEVSLLPSDHDREGACFRELSLGRQGESMESNGPRQSRARSLPGRHKLRTHHPSMHEEMLHSHDQRYKGVP